jgi:hypothetical protein
MAVRGVNVVRLRNYLIPYYILWPEGRTSGSINGKCLTEAKAEGI